MVPGVQTFVVRVWLPDRPGALGQVASRIGAVRGDVVGIEILERGGGSAIDELIVRLPDDNLVDLLVAEIMQVDGVAVEDVRPQLPGRSDASLAALQAAAVIAETEPDKRLEQLCVELLDLVDGSWVAAVSSDPCDVLVERGAPPEPAWLAAFLAGTRHLAPDDDHDASPSELAWAHLDGGAISVVVGRDGRPFHARERTQVSLLGRITDALVSPPQP